LYKIKLKNWIFLPLDKGEIKRGCGGKTDLTPTLSLARRGEIRY